MKLVEALLRLINMCRLASHSKRGSFDDNIAIFERTRDKVRNIMRFLEGREKDLVKEMASQK